MLQPDVDFSCTSITPIISHASMLYFEEAAEDTNCQTWLHYSAYYITDTGLQILEPNIFTSYLISCSFMEHCDDPKARCLVSWFRSELLITFLTICLYLLFENIYIYI